MLKDMSLAKEYSGMCCSDGSENGPKYPYGLCIELNDGSLERIELSMLVNGSVMTKTTFDGQDVSVEVIE